MAENNKAIDLKNGAMKVDPPDRFGRIDIHHGEANLNFGNTEPIVASRCGDIKLGNTLPFSSVIGNTENNAPSRSHYHTE